jgi:hypothetical protein
MLDTVLSIENKHVHKQLSQENHFKRIKYYNKFAISLSQLVAPPAALKITIGATIFSVARYAVAICVVCRNAKRRDTLDFPRQESLVGHFSLRKIYFAKDFYGHCKTKIKSICKQDKIFLDDVDFQSNFSNICNSTVNI